MRPCQIAAVSVVPILSNIESCGPNQRTVHAATLRPHTRPTFDRNHAQLPSCASVVYIRVAENRGECQSESSPPCRVGGGALGPVRVTEYCGLGV